MNELERLVKELLRLRDEDTQRLSLEQQRELIMWIKFGVIVGALTLGWSVLEAVLSVG